MSGNMAAARWQEEMARESGQIVVGVPQIVEFLKTYLDQIPELKEDRLGISSTPFIEWKSNVESILRRTFGEKSHERTEFQRISFYPSISWGDDDPSQLFQDYRSGLDIASAQINSAVKMLETMGVPKTESVVRRNGPNITVSPTFNQENRMNQSQKQTMTVEQNINLAIETIREDYGDEKAEQARLQLESIKTNKSWDNVKAVIKFFADMGKQAFVAVSPVIAATLLTKQP